MILGIPKEILANEKRVAALPESVEAYRQLGFEVWVETAAGAGALRSDDEYAKAGARIVSDAAELFAAADVILKVKQPCYNEKAGKHEAALLRKGALLITFLHPAAPANHEVVQMLQAGGVTSLTMDAVPRTSRAQRMDALTSMSSVTGYKSVLVAADLFPKLIPMLAFAAGVVKPANVLIAGVGVVGLQAIAMAKRLGGIVQAVDIRADAREAAGSLGAKIGGFEVPAELAVNEGGYARALPPDWLLKEQQALVPLVEKADIIILSALVPGEVAPILITRQMIAGMQPGSVIVDVAIDQGGNCEATVAGGETVMNGVTVSGRMNIPGSVPVHASWLYAGNILEYVKNLFKHGLDAPDLEDDIVQQSLVTHQGQVVHKGTLKALEAAAAKS